MDTNDKSRKAPPARQARQKESGAPNKKVRKEPAKPLQDVVYVPPKPFVRNKMLLRLASVAAIVLALFLAMSVFFRVDQVVVSGVDQYSEWDIMQASGIQKGDSLFSLSLPGVAAKINELPYVKNVRVGIKLPHTVMLEITEVRVTYGIKAQNDEWWMIDSGGQVIGKAPLDHQENFTKILGVHLLNPQVGQQAVAQEIQQSQESVTAAQRLSVALNIADQLEVNGILGEAASIDVNDMGNMQIWYGEQYQIKLGTKDSLALKINLVKNAMDTLNKENYQSGVLEASHIKDGNTLENNGVKYIAFQ